MKQKYAVYYKNKYFSFWKDLERIISFEREQPHFSHDDWMFFISFFGRGTGDSFTSKINLFWLQKVRIEDCCQF